MKRNTRWSFFMKKKDRLLVKAWVRLSENATVGNDRKGEVLNRSVNELYKMMKPSYYARDTDKSIKGRVRKVLVEFLSFSGRVAKINNKKPSGCRDVDVIHLVTVLQYKLQVSIVSKGCKLLFRFMSCWMLPNDHPEFDLSLSFPELSVAALEKAEDGNIEDHVGKDNSNEGNEEFLKTRGCWRTKTIITKS